jgi:tetratricopeptide (TPR) repeat protein
MLALNPSLAKIPPSEHNVGEEVGSLKESSDPDQDILERAAELRRQGTVESRIAALVLLEEHRLSLWNQPRYHREIGLLYFDGGRYSNAYDSFNRVLELDSTHVQCRIDMVRVLFWEMHRGDRRDELKDILRLLDESLQLLRTNLGIASPPVGTEINSVFTEDTEQTRLYRSALYLKSLALFEARLDEDSSALRDANSQRGRDLTEEIIRRLPNDQGSDALLLNALHCKDLGDLEASQHWFRKGIESLGDRYRSQYLIPPQLASRGDFKEGGDRSKLIEQYWAEFADPVTGLNDTQLQYWYNLTVADIRFRDLFKDSVRGMDTVPGIMVARFGFPPAMEYRARGFTEGGVATAAADPTLFRDRPAKPMRPLAPRLQLHYPGLTLTFEHYHGAGWQPDTLTVVVLEKTDGPDVPPVLPIRDQNAIERIYLSHAGARGTYSRGREILLAAIPPWNDKSNWWEEAQVTLEVLSSQSLVVEKEERVVKPEDIYEIAPGREVLLVGRDIELPQGHFTGYVTIRDGSGWRTGRSRIPMDVEVIRFRDLAVSELQMIVPETFGSERKLRRPERPYLPNPLGAVGSDGWFEVAYSIYNLDPNTDGDGLYEVTYTILPHNYRLAMEKLRKRGVISQVEESELGTIGHTIGDITLLEENFRQVKFPPSRVRGLAREGREIIARAVVDASTLPSGMYVLQLRVRDVVSDQETIREMSFRKVSDEVLDAMTIPEKR